MPRTGKTAEEIRAAAVDAALARVRTHGFDKVRLNEVAGDLHVSHAALYAHFVDRAALLDAVTGRWLADTEAQLEKICRSRRAPLRKIEDWFVHRYRIKRERVRNDPQLYRAFDAATLMKKPSAAAHLAALHQQLAGLLDEAHDELPGDTPQRQASLLMQAMCAFHHPRLVAEHPDENRERLLKQVLATMLAGMRIGKN